MHRLALLLMLLPMVALGAQPRKRPVDHVRGKEIWERSCWQCHGKEGRGDGPAAADLAVEVPDLRGNLQGSRQRELVDVILNGRSVMPAFSEEFDLFDARRILTYLRRLEEPKPEESKPEEPIPEAPSKPEPEDENRSADAPSDEE